MAAVKKYLLVTLLSLIFCGQLLSQSNPTVASVAAGSINTEPGHPSAIITAPDANDSTGKTAPEPESVDLGFRRIPLENMTSPITSFSRINFNHGLIHDPVQLVQGRVAGLNIVRPGGDPNEDFVMRIRGFSTTQSYGQPLIVIDNFAGASLLGLDPNDIERIVVLRDAASTALFGIRGANGVIQITTRRGQSHRPVVEYSIAVGIENIAKEIPVMKASEYKALPYKTDFGNETEWLRHITRTAGSAVHNLSISGGSDETTYRASLNYRDVEGVLMNSGFSQLNTRVGIRQFALGNKATFQLDLSRTTRSRQLGFPVAFHYAMGADPTVPVYDETSDSPTAGALYGGYAERDVFDSYNPVSIVKQNKNDQSDAVFSGRISGEYDLSDLINGLSFSVAYSSQQQNSVWSTYFPRTAKYGNGFNRGLASKQLSRESNQVFESMVHYNRNLGNISLNMTGGYSLQKYSEESFGMKGGNFLTDAFTYNNIGAALDFDNGLGHVFSYARSGKLEAFVASADLAFKNTYFFTSSLRHEGSSRLGKNNKRGVFPGAGAGIVLSNLLTLPGLDLLKFRMAFGASGNQPQLSYASLAHWGVTGVSFQNGEYKPVYALTQSANPDLQWETKTESNVGVDISLLNNKLDISIDHFRNTVDDLIFNVTDYPSAPAIWANIAKVKNTGIELDLSYETGRMGPVLWRTALNLSRAKTIMEEMSRGSRQYGQNGVAFIGNLETTGCGCTSFIRVKEGEPLGTFWGPVRVRVTDGAQVFADLNGDGYGDGYQDRKELGNAFPDYTFGFHNTFLYKNFSLSFLLRGALGHSIVNNIRLRFEAPGVSPYNVVKTKYYLPDLQNAQFSDYYLEKAGYAKLDNLMFAWRLPLNAGSLLQQLQINFAVQNLFTITKFTGLDPEVRYFNSPFSYNGNADQYYGTNPLLSGMERLATYPRTRTFSFGLSIKI